MKIFSCLLMSCFLFGGCSKSSSNSGQPPVVPPGADTVVAISTDKACYKPGDAIAFTMDKNLPASATIRYRQLDQTVTEVAVTGKTWHWTAPSTDFTGYMVDVYNIENGLEKVYGSVAVDVSSDWTRFPRYGFLSAFGQLSGDQLSSTISNLSRYHLNGIQFQDWEYEHHLPLAGTVSNPAGAWKDIANRDTYKTTVQQYINLSHAYNMNTMTYNLCYGALSDAASAGVADQWYLYTDAQHGAKDGVSLPMPPFKSNIYLLDPSNTAWQNYIEGKTNDVYSVYNFDGYQVDQLGDRGKTLYNYSGSPVSLEAGFGSFLAAMKAAAPSKRLVMNAVNQYGQQAAIVQSPVDFLYTEVWSPNEGYSNLATIIQNNDSWSNNKQKTVLAAYMDYNLANNTGYFNTPGVLLTDAVIFAFGGSHLELGEHMLCKEYFPNGNLLMKNDLQKAMVNYYDFLVAYENLLRDGGSFNTPGLTSADGKLKISSWPPVSGAVSFIGKDMGSRQVIHFINFANAASFDWRDTNGTQPTPDTYQNAVFTCTVAKQVKKIWLASPDRGGGASSDLVFSQSGGVVSFTLPALQYWDMVVMEYQ